jgi:hypothetical protein
VQKERFVIRCPIGRGEGKKVFWKEVGSLWLHRRGGEIARASIALDVLPRGDALLQAYPEDERAQQEPSEDADA